MIRQIIEIDENKCNGCGLCKTACHEGAIDIIDGVAKLVRDDYCDGFGDCLPACPMNAISFIKKDTLPYDEEAVNKAKANSFSCPSTKEIKLSREISKKSTLENWPIQIKLASTTSKFFNNQDLLIAADCTAFSYSNFHNDFLKNKVCLIGCPKLDSIDYSIKLTDILSNNNINNITVVRMEVPCCGGIEMAIKRAIKNSQKNISLDIITISTSGEIL